MIKCPFDLCASNSGGICKKEDIVLEVVDKENDYITCESYISKIEVFKEDLKEVAKELQNCTNCPEWTSQCALNDGLACEEMLKKMREV